MMKQFIPATLLLSMLLVSCLSETSQEYSGLSDQLAGLSKQLAPDRRTDRAEFEYTANSTSVKGYTTLPDALDSLDALLNKEYPDVENKVRLLPDSVIGSKTVGIIKVSVANLRSKPGQSQELATQALLGTPIEVLDLVDNWYLVRTPDRYLAWLEPGAFSAMTVQEARQWFSNDLLRVAQSTDFLTATPGGKDIITDLVAGNLLRPTGRRKAPYLELALPDGVTGWGLTASFTPSDKWRSHAGLSSDLLLETARQLAGRPYLWGGTSPKGMDCSGFTKTAYYLNGYVIPRDASQQVHAGEEVALTNDFRNLLPGDLLFFGRYREDGSEKITHVGMYLGQGRFLHAGADNGRIRTNSLIPDEPDYAEHRLKSLLRARRLSAGSRDVLTVNNAFQALWGE